MLDALSGYKSYLVAFAALVYVAYRFFFLHDISADAGMEIVLGAGAFGAYRSAHKAETDRVLAALGVNPSFAKTPAAIANQPGTLAKSLETIASAPTSLKSLAAMLAPTMLVGMLALGMLAACATSGTPATQLFAAKSDFTIALKVANAYKALPDCPAPAGGSPACKDPGKLANIKTSANATDAALTAAENLMRDPNFQNSDAAAKAATAATAAVTAFAAITAILQAAQ